MFKIPTYKTNLLMNSLYCFAPEGIAIVDVNERKVVRTIEEPGHGWLDGVVSLDHKKIFMNDPRGSQVIVLDLEKNEVTAKLPVGKAPIHMYLTPDGKEVWTHSDVEGAFYVIDVANQSLKGKVPASFTGKGHGKLLLHPELASKAYATNAIDSVVHIIDISKKELIGSIKTSGHSHAKAYSTASKHVYITSGLGKVAIINPQTDTLIKEIEGSNDLFISDDGKTLISPQGEEERVIVIDALSDEVLGTIQCSGDPDHVFFNYRNGKRIVYVVNVKSSNISVLDLDEMKEIKTISIGNIIIPEGQQHIHRSGSMSSKELFIPSSGTQSVDIIDNEKLTSNPLHIGMKVQQAIYVGNDMRQH